MGWKSSVSEGEGGDWGRPLQVAPSSPHFFFSSQAPILPGITRFPGRPIATLMPLAAEVFAAQKLNFIGNAIELLDVLELTPSFKAISLEITFSANATTSCPRWEKTESATLDHSGVDDYVCVPPTFTLLLAQNGPYWFDASHARQSCNTKGKITNSYKLFF